MLAHLVFEQLKRCPALIYWSEFCRVLRNLGFFAKENILMKVDCLPQGIAEVEWHLTTECENKTLESIPIYF